MGVLKPSTHAPVSLVASVVLCSGSTSMNRRPRRFVAVICESIERVARVRPKKATQVLTRRIKQAISEWYVTNMLEMA